MKWAKKEIPSAKRYKWFAWYPVLCDDGNYHWLEVVKVLKLIEKNVWGETVNKYYFSPNKKSG